MDQSNEQNILSQEFNKIYNETYPVEPLEKTYTLGYVSALSDMKNGFSKFMCKECIECIDLIIKQHRESNNVANNYFHKLLKPSL